MKSKIKTLPTVMAVFSGLYVIYVLHSKDTTLQADAVGGDPGGKFLPLIMGAFMFVGFLYLAFKERPSGEKMSKAAKILFFWTLGLSIAYVLLLRPLGYIITTVVLLYSLLEIYSGASEKKNWVLSAEFGGACLLITCAVFALERYVTKTLTSLGRRNIIPAIFKSAALNGVISALLVSVFTVVLKLVAIKFFKDGNAKKASNSAIITFCTVLLLYIVFKQFFSVNLAPGILNI